MCVYFKMNYINLKFYNVFLFQTQYHVRVTVTPQGDNKHCQMSVLSCMKIEATSMYSNYTEDRVLYRVDDDSFWAVSGKSAGILKNTLFFIFIEHYICRYNVRTKRMRTINVLPLLSNTWFSFLDKNTVIAWLPWEQVVVGSIHHLVK